MTEDDHTALVGAVVEAVRETDTHVVCKQVEAIQELQTSHSAWVKFYKLAKPIIVLLAIALCGFIANDIRDDMATSTLITENAKAIKIGKQVMKAHAEQQKHDIAAITNALTDLPQDVATKVEDANGNGDPKQITFDEWLSQQPAREQLRILRQYGRPDPTKSR